MKKIIRADVFFELELEEKQNVYDSAWKFIKDNLPDVFNTEGSELTIYNLNGEEEVT